MSITSRPVERDVQLPLFVRTWATPSSERTAYNPLDFTIYQRGKLYGVREGDGITEYIRCQHCGELKVARRYNFEPHPNTKSGFLHACRECRNASRRDQRGSNYNAYMREYMRSYRERQAAS